MKISLITLIATTAVLLACSGKVRAQENFPLGPENYEQNAQVFAPFELDLDNMSDSSWSGYFFEYNKLYWNYTGERTTIGSSNVSQTITWYNGVENQVITASNGQFAEIIYQVNPGDIVNPNNPVPAPTVVHNALQNAGPRAGFAFGDRYELGYRDQGHGWTVAVLDGPEQNQSQFYGFRPDPANGNGVPPFIDDDYTDSSDIGPGGGTTADPGNRAFGYGSVPVMFETAPGFMQGFRDYMNNLTTAMIGTQRGPYAYVGNYGDVAEASADDDTIPFFHLADDLNGNGIMGSTPIVVIGPDGLPHIGYLQDFEDLHRFNVFFDSVSVHSRTDTGGVELMSTHQLTNRHNMAKHQNNQLSVSWGARYLRMNDEFDVTANGSIIGNSFWDTTFTNNIVGPQVGVQWVNERQRWRIQTDARFMAGYNIANWSQNGLMGESSIPGAINRLIYMRPTALNKGLQEQEFAPVGELRVAASYHITSGFALKAGYTGSVIGGIKRAASSVKYSLPEMGYVDSGTQQMLINGLDFGVEFVR